MKDLYSIHGPEMICVFTLDTQGKTKNIILFGEDHGDKVRKCRKGSHCLTIVELITMAKQTDVFLESAWVIEYLKPTYNETRHVKKHNSALSIMKKRFYKELYGHSRHQTDKRFHYTDIRKEPNIIGLWSVMYSTRNKMEDDLILVLNTVYHFSSATKFIEYMNACVISENYPKAIKDIFGKYAKYYIDKKGLTAMPLRKSRIVHRIKKQIQKLPEDKQILLLKYHSDKLNEMRKKKYFNDYEKSREQALNDEDIKSLHLGCVMHMFTNTLVHLMDMYHLSRMLYYMDKNKNMISYTGSHHTHNYKEFFGKYMGLKLAYIDDKSHVPKGMGTSLTVKIPKVYIDI